MIGQQNAALEPCKECGGPGASRVWGVCRDCFDKTCPAPAGAEAVREALLKYGGHRKRCEYHKRPRGRACSCGWDAIVHALPTALATPQPAPTAAEDGLREAADSIAEAKNWIDHKTTCPCWNSNLGWKWCDCGFERLNDALTDAIDKLAALRAKPEASGGTNGQKDHSRTHLR